MARQGYQGWRNPASYRSTPLSRSPDEVITDLKKGSPAEQRAYAESVLDRLIRHPDAEMHDHFSAKRDMLRIQVESHHFKDSPLYFSYFQAWVPCLIMIGDVLGREVFHLTIQAWHTAFGRCRPATLADVFSMAGYVPKKYLTICMLSGAGRRMMRQYTQLCHHRASKVVNVHPLEILGARNIVIRYEKYHLPKILPGVCKAVLAYYETGHDADGTRHFLPKSLSAVQAEIGSTPPSHVQIIVLPYTHVAQAGLHQAYLSTCAQWGKVTISNVLHDQHSGMIVGTTLYSLDVFDTNVPLAWQHMLAW
jgi:hypothetical protein